MPESTRMIVVLTLIAMVSAGVLSQVYNFTNAVIEENRLREMQDSVLVVLPDVTEVRTIDAGPETLVDEHYSSLAERDGGGVFLFEGLDESGEPIGFAFVAEGTGYGGVIQVLVGVSNSTQEITGVTILEHVETPGLGSLIERASFRDQFVGKTTEDPIRLGEDIDQISGATMSSSAVTEAIRNGLPAAIRAYEGGR